MRLSLHFLPLVFFCLSFLSPAPANAQPIQTAALVESAKKEGKLVWYTSMAIDTSKPPLDALEKDYPLIKTDFVRAGEEQWMDRILTETRAGRWNFDAISTSSISIPSLSVKATGPNAAKPLINFATSRKGQERVREMRRLLVRSDVNPLAAKMDQSKLKLKPVPKEVYLGLDDHAREFRKIFGL